MNSLDPPVVLAEDHEFRSRYVQELVRKPIPKPTATQFCRTTIPRVIVQYWHDLKQIPEDVRDCLNTWSSLKSQGFMRVLFDDGQAGSFISNRLGQRHLRAFKLCYHPAMRCDYFRLCYILLNGGFYVDADDVYLDGECDQFFHDGTLKVQPLCYDTTSGNMISPDSFVKGRQSSPSWIFYINNNPIIAPPHHPVIGLALERATRILLKCPERPEIQSTTGPGNFTASLVNHALSCMRSGRGRDFVILPDWEAISISVWPLSYRNDGRNWRLSNSDHCFDAFDQ